MSAHRMFLEAPIVAGPMGEAVASLASDDLHHLRNVLRVAPGEFLELVEPDGGGVVSARVVGLRDDGLHVEACERRAVRSGARVALVQGLAKGEKMDAIVRQAVELGVCELYPVITDRSVVRLDARKRTERGARWRRIGRAAAEQSHQDRLPVVEDPCELRDMVPRLAAFDLVVVLWEESVDIGLRDALSQARLARDARVALIVGPEGGLAPDEVAVLEKAGARAVTLGPSILRTETAAVVGVALTVDALGGLGPVHE